MEAASMRLTYLDQVALVASIPINEMSPYGGFSDVRDHLNRSLMRSQYCLCQICR